MILLSTLVETSQRVGATSARLTKVRELATVASFWARTPEWRAARGVSDI